MLASRRGSRSRSDFPTGRSAIEFSPEEHSRAGKLGAEARWGRYHRGEYEKHRLDDVPQWSGGSRRGVGLGGRAKNILGKFEDDPYRNVSDELEYLDEDDDVNEDSEELEEQEDADYDPGEGIDNDLGVNWGQDSKFLGNQRKFRKVAGGYAKGGGGELNTGGTHQQHVRAGKLGASARWGRNYMRDEDEDNEDENFEEEEDYEQRGGSRKRGRMSGMGRTGGRQRGSSGRGFASMDPQKQRAIAAKGGRSSRGSTRNRRSNDEF